MNRQQERKTIGGGNGKQNSQGGGSALDGGTGEKWHKPYYTFIISPAESAPIRGMASPLLAELEAIVFLASAPASDP
jgi:hypothetical protein